MMNENGATKERVLVVDDEKDFLNLMVLHLKRKGYDVDGVTDPRLAQKKLEENAGEYAVIVTDWLMPGMSGNSLIKLAQGIDPRIIAIFITSQGGMDSIAKMGFGAHESLNKPLKSMKDLSAAVTRAIAFREYKTRDKFLHNRSTISGKFGN